MEVSREQPQAKILHLCRTWGHLDMYLRKGKQPTKVVVFRLGERSGLFSMAPLLLPTSGSLVGCPGTAAIPLLSCSFAYAT